MDRKDEMQKIGMDYLQRGWKLVPLHGLLPDNTCTCGRGEDCPKGSNGKHPFYPKWDGATLDDEDAIIDFYEKHPLSNMGVLLGPSSGIIDIEADNEAGRELLEKMMKGVFTPKYASGKSIHHLLRYSGEYPLVAKKTVHDIEFRIGNNPAMSVLPPSMHYSGRRYSWLPGCSPDDVEPAEMPRELHLMLLNPELGTSFREPSIRKTLYAPGAQLLEGQRNDKLHSEACDVWRSTSMAHGDVAFVDPECALRVFMTIQGFNLSLCSPPLPENEVKDLVESARKFIQRNRTTQASEQAGGPRFSRWGLEFRDGEWWPGQWRLIAVRSDPPKYKLVVPAWSHLCGGSIEIPADEDVYDDPKKIARIIRAATLEVVLQEQPGLWPSIWCGERGTKNTKTTRGLSSKLMDGLEYEDAPPELKMGAFVAGLLLTDIQAAHVQPDDASLSMHRGRTLYKLQSGDILIRWAEWWSEKRRWHPEIKNVHVNTLANDIGAISAQTERRHIRNSGGRLAFRVLTRSHLRKLEIQAGMNSSQSSACYLNQED